MRRLDRIFNPKAQSILELAIFGSVILFLLGILIQYGIGLNIQEHLTMQTFRKALALARERAHTSLIVDLVVVKDLSMPNPSEQFGISETNPYIASASAVWTDRLRELEDYGVKEDLPRIDFIINENHKTYTIADYKWFSCLCEEEGELRGCKVRKKENDLKDNYKVDGSPGSDNIYWYWKTIDCREIESVDEEYDLDGDGKEERVYHLKKEDENDRESPTVGVYYLDFQEGENVEIDVTKNEDLGEEPQGLLPGYNKTVEANASLVKTETPSGIRTSRSAQLRETIKRIIRTQKGNETITSEIIQNRTSDWQTDW